ncbi:MAG: TIM barrel protein [Cyclobacteriaceae bacterium]|nr:TIM barrel protein [Cyclobacteriaceae bacterium]
MKKKRREFIKKMSGLGVGLITVKDLSMFPAVPSREKKKKIEEICVFSKHLQFLDYEEMAETAAEIGFDGVDLTVRAGGHVLPENVVKDLPRAVSAVEKAGLNTPLMATDVNDPDNPLTGPVLKTAADHGIRHYRMGYLRYDFDRGIMKTLDGYLPAIKKLIRLNQESGIIGNYQNHDGTNVGATIWDLWYLFRDNQPDWIGCQFDIRHATVEGGHSWPVDMQLISPYIHSLVIKDHKWGQVDGEWRIINTPVGEGMVNFSRFFQLVKEMNIGGPVTMHFEYPMTERPEEEMDVKEVKKQVMKAMKKDLDALKGLLKNAELL